MYGGQSSNLPMKVPTPNSLHCSPSHIRKLEPATQETMITRATQILSWLRGGGAFAQATVFALGIQPYINSSIIIQLLTVAIPALERLQREGGEDFRSSGMPHALRTVWIMLTSPPPSRQPPRSTDAGQDCQDRLSAQR